MPAPKVPSELRIAAMAELELRRRKQLKDEADKYNWEKIARPKQLPPKGDWIYWLLMAGRGFGKTRTAAEFIRHRVTKENAQKILIVARSPTELREYCIEGVSGILNVFPPSQRPQYQETKSRIIFHTGAIAYCYSAETPDKIRGAGIDTAWFDEFAAYRYQKEIWETFVFSLREGNPKVVISTTPRNTVQLKKIRDDKNTVVIRGSSYENKDNLTPVFADEILKGYEGTTIGRQEIDGEIVEDVEGALWQPVLIERNRIAKQEMPQLQYVVIGVDPSGSKKGAEAGIVGAGLGIDGHGYVLSDKSLQGSPNEWAATAIQEYRTQEANEIVPEKNFGGEMVEYTIRTMDKSKLIKIYIVNASRGKAIRAEPIVALYEQDKVHHVGVFPKLEDQMCTWDPFDLKADSPDRIDALVWALTRLMVEKSNRQPGLRRL